MRLIRRDLSYSISEIAELFAIHPQAIRQWIKAGLADAVDGRLRLLVGFFEVAEIVALDALIPGVELLHRLLSLPSDA